MALGFRCKSCKRQTAWLQRRSVSCITD